MKRGWVRFASVGSGLAMLVYLTPAPVAAGGNAGVHLHKTVDPAQVTITPNLGLSLGVDKASAIPGDTLTYTAIVANPTATFGMAGSINAQATASGDAIVAYYWDQLEYCSQGCGNGSFDPHWTAIAGTEAGQPGFQPVIPPDVHSGMALAAHSVVRSGVTYPSGGDPILGTDISPSATATWTYASKVVLTPAQAAVLSDPEQAKSIRNVLHFEVVPRNSSAAQPYTDPEAFANPFLAAAGPAAVTNVTVTFSLPDGSTTSFGPAQLPALGSLGAGSSVTATTQFKVPVPAARGTTETEGAYVTRLRNIDGSALDATASATGTGFSGPVSATSTAVTTNEFVPIVTIGKSGPPQVDAGATETNPLTLQNGGGATATSIAVTDSVPGGAAGSVSGTPPALGGGASGSATATYAVPAGQAAGDLTDTASVTWKDANGNPYGPLSSSFTTQVRNILFGARLTLAPVSAGPNNPGTSQTLTATLVDRNGNPIGGQVVGFTVTGANPSTGSATTDAAGNAIFSYTGNSQGTDVAQATVTAPGITLTSNTSTITWLKSLQPVSTTVVQGNFFTNDANSCTFDINAGNAPPPLFSQTFPNIMFNSEFPSTVPHNISGVVDNTRPFTDLTTDVNGNYNGQIIAQGNGVQAGLGPLVNFYGVFTGSFVVNQPGDLTFRILHDDGYIFGVGGGATRVSGDRNNDPVTTPFDNYGVIAAWNTSSTGSSSSGPATVHFPAPGIYPYELDYTECGAGSLFLDLLTESFVPQTSPLSIYVGYADGLRAGGSIFPFPWDGSQNTTFEGCTGCTYDGGAIRIDNSGTTPAQIDSVTVDIPVAPGVTYCPTSTHFDIWPHNLTVPAGQTLILGPEATGTSCGPPATFDTSDTSFYCGPDTGVIPLVNLTSGGVTTTFKDSTQVLNTGGKDVGVCTGNESESWQRIGGGGTAVNLPLPPAASLNLTPFSVPGATQGQSITLTVAAMDGAGNPAGNLPVTLQVHGANTQSQTRSTDAGGLVTFTYTGAAPGSDTVQASAFVEGLRSISNVGSVVWIPPGGTNNPLGPSITSQSPADGSLITKPVPVDATFAPPAGDSITGWRVFYQAAAGGPVVVIGGGSGTPPSPLGVTFDPTLLTDGAYTLTVEATASNGATQDVVSGVAVYGALKIGRYTTSFTDLSVPVDGFEMALRRVYDSTDKSTGDFGVGWRLDLSNFAVSSNRELGAGGWTMYDTSCALGLCTTAYKNSAPRFVTVRFPDGHVEVFDLTPDGGTNVFWTCKPKFAPRAALGTTSTLVPLDDTACSYTGDGNLYGSHGLYNPQLFQLTTRAGQVLVLDAKLGLVSMTDRNANTLSVDATGVHSSNGESLTFTRDGSGRITAVTGPTGEKLGYSYSSSGDLLSSTDANGRVTTYSYDAGHDLLSGSINGTALKLPSQEYDSGGRLVAVVDTAGDRIAISNSVPGQTVTTTDPLGALTTVTHLDDLGDVVARDEIFGGQTLTTAYSYDAAGHMLSRTDPLGHKTNLTYDTQGDLTAYEDPLGNITRFTYDSSGFLTGAIGPGGLVIDGIVYDSADRPVRTTANGATTVYAYDSAGRVTSTTDAAGRVFTMTYDPDGHLASFTDSSGATQTAVEDADGRILSVTDPAGHKVSFTYDPSGNQLSLTDPSGNSQSNTYDALGRMTSSTDAAGRVTTYAYDAAGNLSGIQDRNGGTTLYAYDQDGNLIKSTYPDGEATSIVYDGLGRVTRTSDGTSSIDTAYDSSSQVSSQTETLPVVGAVTNSYTYDAAGNKTSLTSVDGTTHYAYDDQNRLISMTDPHGGIFDFSYDTSGRLTSLSRPNGVTDAFTYDAAGKILSRTATRAGTTVAASSQTYDANGLVATRTDLSGTTTYQHDSTGQLTGVTAPGGATQSYVYDAAGNRVSDPVSSAMTYDPGNRLVSDSNYTYTYDAEGDRTSRTNRSTSAVTRYTYNGHGQLVSVQNPDGTTTSFTYDVLGRRIQVSSGTSTTTFAYDGTNVHLEYSGASPVASYTDPLATDHPLEMRRGGQSYYYQGDVAGNVTGLSDASGTMAATYSYDAFGVPTSSSNGPSNPFTYAGREYSSSSGLYYNRARYYEPTTGRFLSEDPIPSVNAYSYVRNDPVDVTDPTGAGPIIEYLVNTAQATTRQRILGCGLSVLGVTVEYGIDYAFTHKIQIGPLIASIVTSCAFGAIWPGLKPTSSAGVYIWYIFLLPMLIAFVAVAVDVLQQFSCVRPGHPYDPAHTLIVFILAFYIAHLGGDWGAAASGLSGAGSTSAGVGVATGSGIAAGLTDQIPGGACSG